MKNNSCQTKNEDKRRFDPGDQVTPTEGYYESQRFVVETYFKNDLGTFMYRIRLDHKFGNVKSRRVWMPQFHLRRFAKWSIVR